MGDTTGGNTPAVSATVATVTELEEFSSNHASQIVAIDWFTFPCDFQRNCMVHPAAGLKAVVHFNATAHPTDLWDRITDHGILPEETAPRLLLRDRDQIYGEHVRFRVVQMGIEEVAGNGVTPQGPKQKTENQAASREILNLLYK